MPARGKSGLEVSWTTITYRSVIVAIGGVILLAIAVSFFFLPDPTKAVFSSIGGFFGKMLEKTGLAKAPEAPPASGERQAHFTAIEGTVRVKRASNNAWVSADYSVPLEKGDVVQTSSEGMAKLVFADGTNYTVKPDSLIVIEEHSAGAEQRTSVSVQVTTGTVDLTTGTFVQGSRSQVVIAGARATFAPDTSAQVVNDPRSDRHEVLVKKGSGSVDRNGETLQLAAYERASFRADAPTMTKEKEIGPPTLISPANMTPIFVTAGSGQVSFSWTPVPNVANYRLRVSQNPYFSSTVLDKKFTGTDTVVPGMKEGAYYWMVQSFAANGRESVESERNRFTIIPKGAESISLLLQLEPFVQHGHMIEVRGLTEPSARVMVNGQEVPAIDSNGKFSYFTPPLPNGENVITVTAQNAKGGVNTQQKKVLIQ